MLLLSNILCDSVVNQKGRSSLEIIHSPTWLLPVSQHIARTTYAGYKDVISSINILSALRKIDS